MCHCVLNTELALDTYGVRILQTMAGFMEDTGQVRQKFPVFKIFLDRRDKPLHKYHNVRWTAQALCLLTNALVTAYQLYHPGRVT